MSARNGIQVRRADDRDIDQIAAFNLALIAETETQRFDPVSVRRGVARGMNVGDEVRYFVAEVGQRPAGTMMLTREWSDWRDGWLWWLQSVYVHGDFRGRGVFRSMLDHVTELAQADPDVIGLRLYVEDDNDVAQATYLRTGFTDANYRILKKMFDPSTS